MIANLFAGPGGWCVAADALGMTQNVGFEIDEAACSTRAAAGHLTVRADVSQVVLDRLMGVVTGLIASAPCVFFSAAGTRAGSAVLNVIADAIRDQFAGRKTLALRRRQMAAVLRKAGWPDPKASRSPSYARMPRMGKRKGKRQVISRPGRGNAIWMAVRSAALVVEPARFIAATRPEWVALEQVPDVLPLWQVYADELRKLGYSVWCGKLNAADYGVPQTRERAILIASRVRKVFRPQPTHYDSRKGMQLFGAPWVSMAEALGLGATARPAPTVTAGGTRTGGAEPFGHRDRDALETERDAGRWVVNPNASGHMRGYTRGADRPSPGLTGQVQFWSLRRDRGAGLIERGGERPDRQVDEPAPTITAGNKGSGPRLSWALRNNTQPNAARRSMDEPAGTMFFGHRGNDVSWVRERPATTVQGDPRIGRPGHKDRSAGGESQFGEESVRVTVEEAAALQSFPAGYPWQGTKTKRYEQVGNAVPPGLAIAVLGEAAGINWQPVAEKYAHETRLIVAGAA
jgi:DNA (cytosine-5)-methyltransferase 1